MFTHWESPNTGADNLTNFTALGAGYFVLEWGYDPLWYSMKIHTYFGSSTFETYKKGYEYDALHLFSLTGYANFHTFYLFDAVSIRCIKDQEE